MNEEKETADVLRIYLEYVACNFYLAKFEEINRTSDTEATYSNVHRGGIQGGDTQRACAASNEHAETPI